MSANSGVVPGELDPGGQHVGTQARRPGRRSARRSGPNSGSAVKTATAPSGEVVAGVTVATPGYAATSCRRASRGRARAVFCQVDDDGHRTVGAGPVLLGHQVVGLPGGEAPSTGCSRPGARCASPGSARPASASGAPRRAPRAAGGGPTRAAHRAVSGSFVRWPAGRCPRVVEPVETRRTRRGSTRRPASPHSAGTSVTAAAITRHDGDRGGEAEGGVGRQPGQPQAHQRDEHGGRGEHHRPSRGGDGPGGGLADAVAGAEVLHVPGHQQQRVVDADARGRPCWPRWAPRCSRPSRRRAGRCPRSRRRDRRARSRPGGRRRRRSRAPRPAGPARRRCRSARRDRPSGRRRCRAPRRRERPGGRRPRRWRWPPRAAPSRPSGRGRSPARRRAR